MPLPSAGEADVHVAHRLCCYIVTSSPDRPSYLGSRPTSLMCHSPLETPRLRNGIVSGSSALISRRWMMLSPTRPVGVFTVVPGRSKVLAPPEPPTADAAVARFGDLVETHRL